MNDVAEGLPRDVVCPGCFKPVCATVAPDIGDKLNAPATITLGEMTLSTDRSGKLDVWTGAWGFVQPKIEDAIGKPVVVCGDDDEWLEIPMMPLFRQTSVSVDATAGCGETGC